MGDEDISEEKPDERIKITLIGSPGVGKTCIIRSYCHNENNEALRSTSGATYYSNLITINNKLIQIDLWEEKYSILAIVGNKSDLYENVEVNEDEAREYAKQIGATFMLVSSKYGDSIALLFDTLIKHILDPHLLNN